MKKSVRTTISIPAALKARMEAVGEGINWSSVAAQAFEARLAEVITKRGAKDMEDVVARLKASKAKTDDDVRIRGREVGQEWARNQAEAVELQRLDEWTGERFDYYSWSEWLLLPLDDNAAFGNDHHLASSIAGEKFGRQGSDGFWEEILGDEGSGRGSVRYQGAFLVGFVEGALEVWEAVKNQL